MKQCPHCQVQLQDHATFCLYCMRSLDKKIIITPKRKPAWMPLLLLGALVFLGVGIFLLPEKHPEPDNLLSSTASGEALQDPVPPQITSPAGDTQASTTDPPETDPPVTDPPVTDPPVTVPPVTEPPVTEPPVTEPPVAEPPSDIRYFDIDGYRLKEVEPGDTLWSYTSTEDTVSCVIADVIRPSANNYYPTHKSYRCNDGTVWHIVGVMPYAFEGVQVDFVSFESAEMYIAHHAFAGCDVGILGINRSKVEMFSDSFGSLETLHGLPAACRQSDGALWSELAGSLLGATWGVMGYQFNE